MDFRLQISYWEGNGVCVKISWRSCGSLKRQLGDGRVVCSINAKRFVCFEPSPSSTNLRLPHKPINSPKNGMP